MRRYRLLETEQVHQRIAEMGERCREVRPEGDGALVSGAGLLVAAEPEQRQAEIRLGFGRPRIALDCARQDEHRLVETAAVAFGHAEQMQGAEMRGQVLQDLLAQRLSFRLSAFPIGLDGGRQQRVRLLLGPFLEPCVLKGPRPDAALQVPSSTHAIHCSQWLFHSCRFAMSRR